MPTKIRIITNAVSEGAAALGEKLKELGCNVSRVRLSNAPKRPIRNNVKWGCFNMDPTDFGGPVLNIHSSDSTLNKITCFGQLATAGVPTPQFTSEFRIARSWFENAPDPRKVRVYERALLRASEGDGITVVERLNDLTEGRPLYVKGMRGNRREYRIHVFQHEGVKRVFIQQKKRRQGFTEIETYTNLVRNLAGGWIFAHNDITAPRQQTIDIAVAATQAFNLTFGAVDVIEMTDVTQGSVVLEINCAPGLMGATCEFYANAINDSLNGVTDQVPTQATDDDGIPVDEDPEEEDIDNSF